MTLTRVAAVLLLTLAALDARAALSVSVEVGPDRARTSEPLTGQITVSNSGPGAEIGVVLTAPVPGGVNSFSPAILSGGATCPPTVSNNGLCDPSEVMTWNLPAIPAGQHVTVFVAMTVSAGTATGSVLTITGTVTGGASGSASSTVDSAAALTLALDDDADPVSPGALLTYTLTYGNRGASSVTGTGLSFPVPAGTTFVSATGGGSFAAGNVTWAIGTLPATQSDQQQVVVSVDAGVSVGTALRVDAATLTGTSTVAETARAHAVTAVASPSLGLAVELNPDPVRPGEWTTAELTVTNLTGASLFGVTLLARMPAGISGISALLATGGLTCVHGISNNGLCDALELATWSVGTLAAGSSVRVSAPLPINAVTAAGRLIGLDARVSDDAGRQSLRRQTAAVDSDGPLMLAVDESADPVEAGASLTYTLTYGNRGASAMTDTTLSFPLPEGTTFVSATGGGTLVGGQVQWALGTLPATQSSQRQVVVTVDAGLAAGELLNVDPAILDGMGAVAETARGNAATAVSASSPLGLAVEVNPDPVRPNETALAEVTVANRGAAPLSGVVLQVRVPRTIEGISPLLLTGGGTCIHGISNNGLCDATELVNWIVGNLPVGGAVTVLMPLSVAPLAAAPAGYLPSLWAQVSDDVSRQRVARQTFAIDADGPLSLAVDEHADPIQPGGVLTYTLTYANRGTAALTGSSLTFPVPAGTSFVSATGDGTLSSGKVQWALGNLPATQSDQQQVTVVADGALAAGSLLTVDAAEISGTAVVAENARATAATALAASPALGLAVQVNPDPVRRSEWALADVTVTNRTGSSLGGVVLQARMPLYILGRSLALFTGGGTCIHGVANNGLCDATELGNWVLGTLAAGASTTVSIPLFFASTAPSGFLPTLEARVSDDAVRQSAVRQTIAVDDDGPLTLALDEDLDAVTPGGTLSYTLTYGNRGAASIANATLSVPLPAQATLLSAIGGIGGGGRVVWNLGTIAAGSGGRRRLTLSVPGGVPAGSILLASEAVIRGTATVSESARAIAATAVEATKPLGLSVTLGRDPTQPSAALTGELTVTNQSGGTLNGVVLQARVPHLVNSFIPTNLTGGGTCIVGISNNGLCDSIELANWNLGTLAPGAAVSVSMPMITHSTMANGQLMPLETRVADDLGRISTQTRTVLVTPFVDTDADNLAAVYDNCPFFPNPTQTDTDLDLRGDLCECTDENGDGRNTVSDLIAINFALFNPASITPLCDGNNDGFCNVSDITAANLEIFSPTNTSTCARQPVPGP